ncbi:hypothetical protein N7508_000779 [Penicillium antarcticum]|uniref:uncharacterized protein n=1 Tax=Penicillium antarcticum TaxID=416450 RepID=UPI0023881F80|nr:uncharacterized protein N7508_000779 [Penicillium antarcticum]KAJ5320496.1 hypothetical protein N7508_000779 [Penicillium antarcticum]
MPYHLSLAKSIRKLMLSTRLGNGTVRARSLHGTEPNLTITMEDTYDYRIGGTDFDPEKNYAKMAPFGNQVPENCVLNLHDSNMISRARSNFNVTSKLCTAAFRDEDVPEEIGESEEKFLERKQALLCNSPADVTITSILQSCRETIQHAKAVSFLIQQLCIIGKDLSE